MRTYTIDEFHQHKERILKEMRSSVFICPTDTFYSLSCNAMVHNAVARLRQIKPNFNRSFMVIAPSKEWIHQNCITTPQTQEWLDKLPGPYTLHLELKPNHTIDPSVLNGSDVLSVRIPQHYIAKIVEELGYPLVTTSANHVGQNTMQTIEELDSDIAKHIDFAIDDGTIIGTPSQIIKLE